MKSGFLITAVIMLAALLLSAGYIFISGDADEEIFQRRAMLVMRNIGHKILLKSGDSTSRILPVSKMTDKLFQIEFQSRFTFVPDTLVKIVHGELSSGDLPLHYVVNVRECMSDNIIYGYEIGDKKNTIVPCIGRDQTEGCYSIQIAFLENRNAALITHRYFLLIITMVCLTGFGFIGRKYFSGKPVRQTGIDFISLGKYVFYFEKRILKFGQEIIELSEKEAKILKIFFSNPNQVIDRDRILKEVWEDHGVFVGRSPDVFISRLRKKLQNDPYIRIINIHGKGYKLEIDH